MDIYILKTIKTRYMQYKILSNILKKSIYLIIAEHEYTFDDIFIYFKKSLFITYYSIHDPYFCFVYKYFKNVVICRYRNSYIETSKKIYDKNYKQLFINYDNDIKEKNKDKYCYILKNYHYISKKLNYIVINYNYNKLLFRYLYHNKFIIIYKSKLEYPASCCTYDPFNKYHNNYKIIFGIYYDH